MKKAIIVSLLAFISYNGFAQSTYTPVKVNNTVCRVDPDMPANAVPAWPKSAYTPMEDPSCAPCYQYKNKRGTTIMECPFLVFSAEHNEGALSGTSEITTQSNMSGNVDIQASNTYTGNYPACSKSLYPAHTTPVWPKSAYTPVGNPNCAPCYEYTNKRGTAIMECPYLVFPPEDKK